MAIGEMTFFSRELQRSTHFRFILPDGPFPFDRENPCYAREAKVLILLHGHGNSNDEWITNSSIRELASRYNIAVFMPNGENSFYLNREAAKTNYMNYVGRELPEFVCKSFGFSSRRENMMIGGLSMGGFGALHTGLAFPDAFGKIMALSSALIIHMVAGLQPGDEDRFGGYDYYTSIFGPLEHILESDVNPEQLALKAKKSGAPVPEIFMACGTEDFLLENNRQFHRFLENSGIPHQYYEDTGDHNFQFWNPWLLKGIQWMAS